MSTSDSLLVLLAPAAPAALAALWPSRALRPLAVALAPWAALPGLVLAVWPVGAPEIFLPNLFTGVRLGLDYTGRNFLSFTALLWLVAGIYARSSMAADPRRAGFFGFFLLTMTGNLGLVLAQDALSFYLFFALTTFAAYGLIVHARGPAEFYAGRVYIIMAVFGDAFLLFGLILAAAAADSLLFGELDAAYRHPGRASLLTGLFLAGFGIKAGLIPLHVWLPLAHPVAPTPASALLSGAVIEAGLLGWIRFLPLGNLALPDWGTALLITGVLAAFYGPAIGFTQDEPKTILAYSSISQMGFMVVGVSLALISPAHATVALLAVGYYAAHHAVAKGALFLGVGVTPGAGMPAWWRRLTYLGKVALALGLAGAPLTGGAAAKTTLKDAGAALPGVWPEVLALLLGLAAAGTTLLLARYLVVLPQAAKLDRPPLGMWLPWSLTVLLSLAAPLWLPWVQPPPPGTTDPEPVLGIWDSLWPILVGLLIALALWRFRHHLPHPARIRIPPGDLVVPLARAVAAASRPWRRATSIRPGTRLAPAFEAVRRRLEELGATASRVDRRLTTGTALGLLLFLLLAIFAATLRGR